MRMVPLGSGLDVGLEGGRVHGHQDVGRVARRQMSWSEMCTWKAETPARVPAGARISAGKSGNVARSFPKGALDVGEPVAGQLHAVARVSGESEMTRSSCSSAAYPMRTAHLVRSRPVGHRDHSVGLSCAPAIQGRVRFGRLSGSAIQPPRRVPTLLDRPPAGPFARVRRPRGQRLDDAQQRPARLARRSLQASAWFGAWLRPDDQGAVRDVRRW